TDSRAAPIVAPLPEPVAPPRFATMPDFPDRESVKKAGKPKKKKKPSVIWPRVWNVLRHPSFVWVAGAVTIAVLAGVIYLAKVVTGTPGYAVGQIETAIRHNNGTKLAYYADGARIARQVVDQTTDWLVAHRGMGAIAGLDGVDEARGKREKVQAAKLAMLEALNRSLSVELINHRPNTVGIAERVVRTLCASPPLAKITGEEHFDVTAVGQPVGNDQTAQIAVTLQYRELQVDVPIAIDMQQAGRRWRVVGVSGLSHALDIVNTAQAERRAIDNRSVAERVAATLEVGAPTVERKAHGRKQTTYLLHLPLTNHSADTVIGVMLALRTHASEAAPAMELEVQHPIAGGTTSPEVWRFDESASKPSAVAAILAHPDRLVVRVRDVVIDSAGQADTIWTAGRRSGGS
ncbi:MAG: hypothetical protein ACHQTF_06965, partial [Gemmatimonadales bacterium]